MINIKQATEKDIPILEEIMIDVVEFLDNINQPLWARQNITWTGLSQHYRIEDFYIAYINDVPLGCMALIDHDPAFWADIEKGKSLFLHKLAVKRSGAKRGVSTALIDYAKQKSVTLGIGEVRLDAHQFREKVRALYESQGFVCVEEKCLLGRYYTAFYLWKETNLQIIKTGV